MKQKRYPRRDAIKNYFPLPNEIFSLGLHSGEISVYAYLSRCEDRKTYQCHPSYKTIGRAVRMSGNTVRKYVSGLEEKGLIQTAPSMITTKDGRQRNGSLIYTLRPIQEAIDRYNEQQLTRAEQAAERYKVQKRLAELEANHNGEDDGICA